MKMDTIKGQVGKTEALCDLEEIPGARIYFLLY